LNGTYYRPVSLPGRAAGLLLLAGLTAACGGESNNLPTDSDAVAACRARLTDDVKDGARSTVGVAADGSWRVRIWTGTSSPDGTGTSGPPDRECRVVRDGDTVAVTYFGPFRSAG
jgi:hypothetical protein